MKLCIARLSLNDQPTENENYPVDFMQQTLMAHIASIRIVTIWNECEQTLYQFTVEFNSPVKNAITWVFTHHEKLA